MNAAPDRTDAARRARIRAAFLFAGVVDLALAGLFLGWGASLLLLEERVAWLVAAVLAASGVIALFVAMRGFGRRGSDGGADDGPVVRR